MAFQASVSATQISLSPSGCAISIVDESNYDASNNPPDPQHTRARFQKKHIVVTNPDAVPYTMDSILAPPVVDESIDPPSSGSGADTVQFDFNLNDANGTYLIELFTIPTWQQGTNYDESAGHVVYFQGVIYRTTVDGNSAAPDSLNNWVIVDYDYLRTTSKYFASAEVEVDCLAAGNTYQTLLFDSDINTYSVEVQDQCGGLVITDESLYEDNTESGHNVDDFSDYRTITIFKPTNSSSPNDYVMSSVAALNPDEAISAPSSGNNVINYNFLEGDKDGLYMIAICSYPTWRSTANYTANPITVVYYNGVLYKLLQANSNQQPDISPDYWEVYELDGEQEYTTRYCYIARVAVMCINIAKCMERKLHKAFCETKINFCNDDVLCKNPHFMAATKMLVLERNVQYSMNRRAWDEVESQFNMINTICNC